MKRISLIVAGALACLAFASVGTAAAMPTEGIVNTACSTSSSAVVGNKVTATVAGKNVDPSQMEFAECKVVKKVMNTVIKRVVESPMVVEGFRITPSITSQDPLVVKYKGLFRGADTATEIRLAFKVEYTAAAAGPEPETPKIDTTCTTNSKNVIGNKVKITVAGKNVAQSQKKFAECPTVKKVANKMLSLRIEKPKVFEGYRCTPTVLTGGEGTVEPQKVRYNCLFRAADAATEIRLKFSVTYNTD